MRVFRSRLRFRLSAWYMLSFMALLIGSSLAIYLSVKSSWERRLKQEERRAISTTYTVLDLAPKGLGSYGYLTGDLMFLAVEKGQILYHSAAVEYTGYLSAVLADPELLTYEGDKTWRSADGREFALVTHPMHTEGHGYRVTVGVETTPMKESLDFLAAILVATLAAGVLFSAAGGYLMAGRALAPLGRMAEKARRISADNLSERLPAGRGDDELGVMASAFNQALERLEESFERMRAFTANVSHELRTPLTAIKSVGEVALRAGSGEARCRDAIGSMLEEADRLVRLVEDLLTLSRAEARRLPQEARAGDLNELVRSVADTLLVLAEEKGQSLALELSPPLLCRFDEATMRQVFINVLDNAIRFTPPGGAIRLVSGPAGGGDAIVDCLDEAPLIPEEERENIFHRFHRRDSQHSAPGGNGIGLAISKWAIELNGGSIAFDEAPVRGNRCRITLPLAQDPGLGR
jgi:signal transduction histidine kinase